MLQATKNQFDFQDVTEIGIEEPTTSESGIAPDDLTVMERFDLETSLARLFKRIFHRIKKNLRS